MNLNAQHKDSSFAIMLLATPTDRGSNQRVLHAYLLGRVHFDEALALQQQMVYEVAGDRSMGVVILCEHPPGITIGREGSASHIDFEEAELQALRWPVRWVNRGGGCLLHLPGQIACYPILAMDALGIDLQEYLDRLCGLIRDVLSDCDVPAETQSRPGVWVGVRQIAHVGIAVRDWISYFGCAINVDPLLKPFRRVRCDGEVKPMTSMERERRGRARVSTVRQRLLELIASRFGFERVSLFHHHPSLPRKARVHAVATPA
jgi:lipoyl(octanoyl) transferase